MATADDLAARLLAPDGVTEGTGAGAAPFAPAVLRLGPLSGSALRSRWTVWGNPGGWTRRTCAIVAAGTAGGGGAGAGAAPFAPAALRPGPTPARPGPGGPRG